MIYDDDELFDDAIPVAPGERGESFGLTPTCYRAMAKCSMRAKQYGAVEPTTIRRLKEGSGCALTLYGSVSVYTVIVAADTAPASISLYAAPLDIVGSDLGDQIAIGYDTPQDWLKFADCMIWAEGDVGSDELVEWEEVSSWEREHNDWP